MIFLTLAWGSCSAILVELFYHPITHHLNAKIWALDPSDDRNQSLEIFDAGGALSNLPPQGLLVYGKFSSLNPIFSIKKMCENIFYQENV